MDAHQPAISELSLAPQSDFYEISIVAPDGRHAILSTYLTADGGWQLENEYRQLYDYDADPREQNNLCEGEVDCIELALFDELVEKGRALVSSETSVENVRELSEAEKERLRALGYLN